MPVLQEPRHELNGSDDNRQNPSALQTENESVVAHLQLHVQFQRNVVFIFVLFHEHSFAQAVRQERSVHANNGPVVAISDHAAKSTWSFGMDPNPCAFELGAIS